MTVSKKLFFGAAIGTMIEYYDYVLFSTLLPILAPLFFPSHTAYQSLIKGYFLLLLSMLARPLGGLFFGYLGDFLGRRKALLASIYGIAIATFAIGIAPTYAYFGTFSAIFLMAAKTAQIFCFGGEYNGAGIYVVEHAKKQREALSGSMLTAMTLLGSLIASVIGMAITVENMPAWSWRIAFLMGGVGGTIGIIYRNNFLETQQFSRNDFKRISFIQVLKFYHREIWAGIFIGGLATVPFTTVLTFITPILMIKGYFNGHQLMILDALLILIAIVTFVPVGLIADRISPKKVMSLGCWCLGACSFPLLWMVDTGTLSVIILACILLVIGNEVFLGPSNAFLKNLFAVHYRYRCSSLSFAVCSDGNIYVDFGAFLENMVKEEENFNFFKDFFNVEGFLTAKEDLMKPLSREDKNKQKLDKLYNLIMQIEAKKQEHIIKLMSGATMTKGAGHDFNKEINQADFKKSLIDLHTELSSENNVGPESVGRAVDATITLVNKLESNKKLLDKQKSYDKSLKAIEEYARKFENKSAPHGTSSRSKKIMKAVIIVVAASVGFVFGATVGAFIGFAAGVWSEGYKGALISTGIVAGLSFTIFGGHKLYNSKNKKPPPIIEFKIPSVVEKSNKIIEMNKLK